MRFSDYERMRFERPRDGVLLVTLDRPEQLNATDERLHAELAAVWADVDRDPDSRVVVVTGAGRAFSAGGDLDLIRAQVGDYALTTRMMEEAARIVRGVLECAKPVVSAVNGAAYGAGLAVALLADVSVVADDARLADGHVRLGLAAGDHAVLAWPLLCGMAKAKYYLLTAESLDGREAERIGLVSRAVPAAEVLATALDVAAGLAAGPVPALRWTKAALNNWFRAAWPTFEASLVTEMLGFFGPDAAEGVAALGERRPARFPSTAPPR